LPARPAAHGPLHERDGEPLRQKCGDDEKH
jgi:hypothetical protein